jgi:hypothetical protein
MQRRAHAEASTFTSLDRSDIVYVRGDAVDHYPRAGDTRASDACHALAGNALKQIAGTHPPSNRAVESVRI